MPSQVTVFPNELPVQIKITAFDALGNRITRGGANFEVRVQKGQARRALRST